MPKQTDNPEPDLATTSIRVHGRILAQCVRRYGEPAWEIIKRPGRYSDELDAF